MDRQAQIRAIVDRLAGRPGVPLPLPTDLDEPWRTIYLRVQKAGDFTGAERQLYHATEDLPGGSDLARDIVDAIPAGDLFAAYPSLLDMDVRFPPVSWLWPAWIPRRMLTILGAAPGAGKSLVALDLARRIIEGLPFPDGAPPARRGRVLVVDAENAPLLLQERARAWAFDRHRLFLMLPLGPASSSTSPPPPARTTCATAATTSSPSSLSLTRSPPPPAAARRAWRARAPSSPSSRLSPTSSRWRCSSSTTSASARPWRARPPRSPAPTPARVQLGTRTQATPPPGRVHGLFWTSFAPTNCLKVVSLSGPFLRQ